MSALGQFPVTAVQIGADLVASLSGNVYGYRLTRLSINGPAGSTAFAYVGNLATGQFDNTRQGSLDTSEYPNPVDIPPGSQVFVVWPGVTGTATATFSLSSRD
jgi:hypothetical protein